MKKVRFVFILFGAVALSFLVDAQTKATKFSAKQISGMQQILDKSVDNKKIFGTSFTVKHHDRIWSGAAGNMNSDQPYFIASTTKLFTTAMVMQLISEGKIGLDDSIGHYIDSGVLYRLHIYKGKEYTSNITVRHLLAHTSGLPDYFQNKGPSGISLEDELIHQKDQHWTFEQAMERTKTMEAFFEPGTPGKAHYSDANFQLLGKIIEQVTGRSYDENCQTRIIGPLNLTHTYMYRNANDTLPKWLNYENRILRVPLAMTSFGPDGGMVSTSEDMLLFIEAFFNGALFPETYITQMKVWNRIFFPMRAGIGIHLFRLPAVFNPTGAIPDFIGHSGLSGALAFYSPEKKLWIAGTVNQVAHPDLSFRTMIKLMQVAIKKE